MALGDYDLEEKQVDRAPRYSAGGLAIDKPAYNYGEAIEEGTRRGSTIHDAADRGHTATDK